MTAAQDPRRESLGRIVVLIPTYNERENLPLIVARVRAAQPDVDILVLEDNSPDGTGEVADALAAQDPHVQVLHRAGKEGLGKAYLAGFAWALEHGYGVAVEMDADGSHQPEQLHRLLDALPDADLVIGSRWVKGGSIVNWPVHRKALSVGGNIYIKAMLGMPVNDVTAGYRAYKASTLRAIDLHTVESAGYCFQSDLTRRVVEAGLKVVEVPIEFVEREIGESKMNPDIARETFANITRWGVDKRRAQLRTVAGRVRRHERWHRL